MKPPFIYALIDPLEPSHIRYIGMTMVNPNRPYMHAQRARSQCSPRTHTIYWARSLQAQGRDYNVIILEKFTEDTSLEVVYDAEQTFIDAARIRGDKLTNKTDGGPGCLGLKHSDESRALTSRLMKERFNNPDYKAIHSASQKRRYADPLERTKASALHIGYKASEVTKAKLKEAAKRRKNAGVPGPMTGRHHSEDFKEKLRQRMTGNTYTLGRKLSPEHINKIIEVHLGRKNSEESKRLMSERRSKAWASGMYSSEEYRNKQRISHSGQSVSNKGIPHTKETRTKMVEAQHKYHSSRKLDSDVLPLERLQRQIARAEKKLSKLRLENVKPADQTGMIDG